MCLAVYVASNQPLPTSKWQSDAPAFYVEAAPKGDRCPNVFSHRNVYYIGSHEGCGCGFRKSDGTDDDLAVRQKNYETLAAALRKARSGGADLELYACWEGEQSKDPLTTVEISIERIESPSFEIRERQLARVTSEESAS